MAEQHEEDIHLDQVYSKTETFIQKNQQPLTIGVVAVLAVVVGVYYYFNMYLPPLQEEAQDQMYTAQKHFQNDSLQLAMYGDAQGNLGFEDIVDQFGSTNAGNTAKYYMGVSLLRSGNFEDAISYLKSYDAKDEITAAIALGAIGDAMSELGDEQGALDYYVKAANARENEFTTPIYLMKAGNLAERLNNHSEAIKHYKRIKKDYARTQEGRTVEKYIARAEAYVN
jgi:predicted negative regulator of RcsB-dependent stress response